MSNSKETTEGEDRVISGQDVALFSFIPALDAKPGKHGIYGFAKIRGTYANDDDAVTAAARLVKESPIFNQILHPPVGRMFPITESSNFSKVVNHVDVKQDSEDTLVARKKMNANTDQKEVNEITEREKKLQNIVDQEGVDPLEGYTTLVHKLAQLRFCWVETKRKIDEMMKNIIEAEKFIGLYDYEYPQFKDKFMDKFISTRKKVGLHTMSDNNYVKYMINPVEDNNIDYYEAHKVEDERNQFVPKLPDHEPELKSDI